MSRVGHDLKRFSSALDETDSMILTLADQPILKEGRSLNEEEDELINIDFLEKEKANLYKERKKKKPVYDVYNEWDESEKTLLPQYNEEKKASFLLEEAQGISQGDKLEAIRQKLAIPGKELYTLNTEKIQASEYFTPEDMIQFKKASAAKRKAKKLRKRTVADLVGAANVESETNKVDHGSRSTQRDKLKEAEEQAARRKANYDKAVEKAKEETRVLFNPEADEDESLVNSLTRAKQQPAKKSLAVDVAALVQRRSQQQDNKEPAATSKEEQTSLVFTPTSEFLRVVKPVELPSTVNFKKPKKEKVSRAEIGETMQMEDEDYQNTLRKQVMKEKAQRTSAAPAEGKQEPMQIDQPAATVEKSKPDSVLKPTSVILGAEEEEPDLMSVAATLKMLKKKGASVADLDTVIGRGSDKKYEKNTKDEKSGKSTILLEYKDEWGRQLTPKEAFRRLSHKFHGKKPGKNKTEKRLKKILEEKKRKEASSSDTLVAVNRLQQLTEKTQSPFIILSGSGVSSTPLYVPRIRKLLTIVNRGQPSFTGGDVDVNIRKGGSQAGEATSTAPIASTAVVGGPMMGEFAEFKLQPKRKGIADANGNSSKKRKANDK